MDPPPLPATGRFRLRINIYSATTSGDHVYPKKSFLIAKSPALALPDLTIRQLCDVILKRYKQIYPSESLFSIQRSQDESGSDLYLEDRVGDLFEDNEVFRIVQGASIRESLPPDPRACRSSNSLGTTLRDSNVMLGVVAGKKRDFQETSDDYEAHVPEKRHKGGNLDPDRPIPSCERDISQLEDVALRSINDETVIPDTQPLGEQIDNAATVAVAPSRNRSPQLVPVSDANHFQQISMDDDQDLPALISPSSSTNSRRGESVFSTDTGQTRGRKLKILPTPKKRLVSQERSRSRSTAATTPTHQEHQTNSTIASAMPLRATDVTTPKTGQRLRRPTIYMSNRNRNSSGSKGYDEIEESDQDEPLTTPKDGKLNHNGSDDPTSQMVASRNLDNNIHRRRSLQNPVVSTPGHELGQSVETKKASLAQILLQESRAVKKDMSTPATTIYHKAQSGNQNPREVVEEQANRAKLGQENVSQTYRPDASTKPTTATFTQPKHNSDAKAQAELRTLAADAKRARQREHAAAVANKQAEARAKATEAEVARLRADAEKTVKQITEKLTNQMEGLRESITKRDDIHLKLPTSTPVSRPKETPIPAPKPLANRSSTPFIPRGRSVTRPLKSPGPGTPPPPELWKDVETEADMASVRRRVSFDESSSEVASKPSSIKCSQILPPKKQTTLIPVPPVEKTNKVVPKTAIPTAKPQVAQRTLHIFTKNESDAIKSSPILPGNTITVSAFKQSEIIKSNSPTRIADDGLTIDLPQPIPSRILPISMPATVPKQPDNQQDSAALPQQVEESESSPDSNSTSDSSSSEDDSDSSDEDDTVLAEPTTSTERISSQQNTPELIAAQLSSSALYRTSKTPSSASPGLAKPMASQTPSLRRMCEKLRSENSSNSSPILPPSKPSTSKKFLLMAMRKNNTASASQSELEESSSESNNSSDEDTVVSSAKQSNSTSSQKQPSARRTYDDLEEGMELEEENEMELCRKELGEDIAKFVPASSAVQPPDSSPTLTRAVAPSNREKKKKNRNRNSMKKEIGRFLHSSSTKSRGL